MNSAIRTIVLCGGGVLATQLTGCGHGNNGHIVDLGGINHRDGNTDPLVNCVACHGEDLRGKIGPNCYIVRGDPNRCGSVLFRVLLSPCTA